MVSLRTYVYTLMLTVFKGMDYNYDIRIGSEILSMRGLTTDVIIISFTSNTAAG